MSFDDRDGLIWLDGKFVDWRDAKIHVLTHTLHYGVGVFEGVRAYATEKGPAIFRLREHTDRLFQSAKIMGMEIPYSKGDELNSIHEQGNVETIDYRPSGTYVVARVPASIANRLAEYSLEEEVVIQSETNDDEIDWVALGRGRHKQDSA